MGIASKAERKLLGERLDGGIRPNYSGLGLSNILPTISHVLGEPQKGQRIISDKFLDYSIFEGISKFVFLFVDGFGYHDFNRIVKRKRLGKAGNDAFFPLTSILPSTTVTANMTYNMCLTPQEHAVMGFKVYLKEFRSIVNMLNFTPAGSENSLIEAGIDPYRFFGVETIHNKWKRKGIRSRILIEVEYADAPLSHLLYRGAEIIPCTSLPDMLSEAARLVKEKPKGLVWIYYDDIDSVSHQFGTRSKAVSRKAGILDYELHKFIDSVSQPDTMLIITSDHGLMNTSPKKTVNLNDHRKLLETLRLPPLSDWDRLVYLFAKKGEKDAARKYMERNFSDTATILESPDAVKQGLFGLNAPKKELAERIGDFILLPKDGYVYTHKAGLEELLFSPKGVHGGTSKEEMLVPFICKRLG